MSKITVVEMNDITKSAHANNITAILLDLGYEVNLIGLNADKISEPMRSNEYCHKYNIVRKPSKGKIDAIAKRLEKKIVLKKTFRECMKDSDCVWVVSMAGFIPLKKEIIQYDNVVRVAELISKLYMRDRIMGRTVFRRIPIEKEIVKAQKIVVPEINRAYIQKAWWKLSEIPAVLPNKPYNMETGVLSDALLKAIDSLKAERKKIILYMGVVGPDRNIEDFARAVEDSQEYAFYLAGNVLPYAKASLKKIESYGGKYLGAFNRPEHFELIKYAHIGALPYVPTDVGGNSELNALYCAPNKIFEYAGFEVPMIGSDVLGLRVPFEKWGIGECCSNQPEDILRAIGYVEKHYEKMQENCKAFYDSVDVQSQVKSILNSIGIQDGIKKTRILMTVPDLLFAGIQSFTLNMVKNFDLSRYQIDFYVYQKFEETYEPYLKKLGCNVYYAETNRPGLKGFIRTSFAINSFLKTHHYDIVICHSCQSRGILKGVAGSKINRRPLVIAHAHGMDIFLSPMREKIGKVIYRLSFSLLCDYRFACSEITGLKKFGKAFTKSSTCKVIKDAVNLEAFNFSQESRTKWRKSIGANEDTIVIGNVARFAPEKNHDKAIDIFAEFNKTHSNSMMVLVGDGALMDKIKRKTTELGIEKNVVFLGYRTDVNDIINAFDIFLFPSKTEGLGFVLIEAQVNGVPCIASADVIPLEADLNIGLLSRVSLTSSAKEWADSCDNALKGGRINSEKSVKAAKELGYDIVTQCDALDNFFQEALSKQRLRRRR